jgi:hypothetical protein
VLRPSQAVRAPLRTLRVRAYAILSAHLVSTEMASTPPGTR